MKNRLLPRLIPQFLLLIASLVWASALQAQDYTFTTMAGLAGKTGSTDGPRAALFSSPRNIANDSAGNFYVADTANHIIRKITSAGVVTTLAGKAGSSGSTNGTGTDARFNQPSGVAVDSSGNIYVADRGNHTIRIVSSTGVVTTVAGSAGSSGSTNGSGSTARFNSPTGITISPSGVFFVADTGNNTIRRMTGNGEVTTYAGSAGNTGSAEGTGAVARFNTPTDVTADSSGTLYVADSGNHTIRKISTSAEVSTLAGAAGASGRTNGTGGSARFDTPSGVGVDTNGNVFVADPNNHQIRRISSAGVTSTFVGNGGGNSGANDGNNNDARFNGPLGLTVLSNGDVYVADTANHTIRKISNGNTTTFAGTAGNTGATDGAGSGNRFAGPRGVAVDTSGNVYVADSSNDTIRKITPVGVVTTLAGNAGGGGANSDGTGTGARFNVPSGVAVDGAGTVYVADASNHTIRKVTSVGVVTTLAGLGGSLGTSDGLGNAARFRSPKAIAADTNGNLYVADTSNHTIRKVIASSGNVTTFAGGAGSSGTTDGNGTAARFNLPGGIAVDSAGVVYVADTSNHTIRRISTSGGVSTLAGSAGNVGSTDGSGSAARFRFPTGIATDSAGNIYVAEQNNNLIRKITPSGDVTTLGGSTTAGAVDGTGSAARFDGPTGLAVDSAGNLYVGDTDNNIVRAGAPGVPVLTSSTTASAATGSGFNYTATFSGVLGGPFTANALPTGLSFNSSTGVVGGTFNATSGSYVVTFTATNGAGTGTGTLTITTIEAPSITTQPASQTVDAGSNVTFSVAASGTPPFTYQWFKNGNDIAGATSSSLTLTNVTTADNDTTYIVNVSNAASTVTSAVARLTVTTPSPSAPTITTQPAAQVASAGSNVTFTVAATGFPIPTYQWRKDGNAISGATASSLTLTNISSADTASYTVVVTNSQGSATSSAAVLAVTAAVPTAPTIATQPAAQVASAGSNVTFSVTASGNPTPTYQWRKDGNAISGATSSSLNLTNISSADTASYTVVVTNSQGSVTSSSAVLAVTAAAPSAPTITTQPEAKIAAAGTNVTFTVATTGSPAPTYQWRKDGNAISGATSSSLTLTSVSASDTGVYTVVATNSQGSVTSSSAVLAVSGTGTAGSTSWISNLALRTPMASGQVLIVGAVVRGGSKNILLRAGGPTLAGFGVPDVMADPKLDLVLSNGTHIPNDNWDASLAATFTKVGAFAFTPLSKDAALSRSLADTFTVLVEGTGAGVVLVEAYDIDGGSSPRLVNVSARNKVGTGANIMIAGVSIGGTGSKEVLIRAVGPTLSGFGVSGVLADPKLEVYNSSGQVIASNDNWTSDLSTTFTAVGAFGLSSGSKDAALKITLPAGASYTVQVSGADGGTGEALIEVYDIPLPGEF